MAWSYMRVASGRFVGSRDDVSEVKTGIECGIAFEKYGDIKLGDVIESFTVEKVAATV